MADQLHQMTIEYVAAEDRLLFRVSTTARLEYQLWLTRRLVAGMWKMMVGTFAQAPDVKEQPAARVKKAIMSMQHQEAVGDADFATKRQTDTQAPPGMEDALLVTAVSSKRIDEHVRRLQFRTTVGKDISINLTEEMTHALCHLIQQGADKAGWKLGLVIGDAAATGAAEPAGLLH